MKFSFQVISLLLCKADMNEPHVMGHKTTIYTSFISFSTMRSVSIAKGVFKIIFCLRNYNNDLRNGS